MATIVDRTEEWQESIDHVRKTKTLARKVFGFFAGLSSYERLEVINVHRNRFFGPFSRHQACIQTSTSSGSRMIVYSEGILNKAEQFAQLYEEEFKKDLTIETDYSR